MNWPLLDRGSLESRVRLALEARPFGAAMLTGPTGIGKSTLARAVLGGLEQSGRPIVPILALRELSDVPLGAFAPAIESAVGTATPDLTSALTNGVATIARSGDAVLFVDDAPLLDDLSAAAIYQLVRVHKLSCLLTARDEHPLTGAIQRLEHEGIINRIVVEPLTANEVDQLLERHLGSPVAPESVRTLHARSEGNPLVVRTLAQAAEDQHTIRDGSKGLVVDTPRLPRHVSQIMSERLSSLSVRERNLAEQIALAQPLPVGLVGDAGTLDSLLAEALVVVSPAAEGEHLTIFHPLAAQLLIDEMSPQRRRDAASESATLLGDQSDSQLRFRAVMLRVRHGIDETPERLGWAAGYAVMVQDYTLATQLAQAAIRSEPNFPAQLALGTAASASGDPNARVELERARELATSQSDYAIATLRIGHHLAIRENRPSDAVGFADTALSELTDAEARGVLEADLVKWRSMAGAALPSLTEAAAPPLEDGLARLGALISEAMVGSMVGATGVTRAAVAAARPLAAAHRAEIPFGDDLLDLNEFLVLVFDGDLREAERYATARRSAPRSDATGQWSYTLGLITLHTGRVADAEHHASEAVTQLELRDFTGLLGSARALHATTLAQLGRPEEARGALANLAEAHRQDVKVVLQVGEAEAAALAVGGDRDAAASLLLSAAASGSEQNHLALSALTLYAAIRFDRAAAVAGRLGELAAATGSRLIALLSEHAAATLSRDPKVMADVAAELDRVGLVSSARDLWAQAEFGFERSGEAERARKCRLAQERIVLASPRLIEPIAPERSGAGGLTDREREIANAAASRRSSREIANALGVSTRTIDNHLGRVYRKLGVRSRRELAAALSELSTSSE